MDDEKGDRHLERKHLGPEWMHLSDMPVRLTNNTGAIDCTFLNTAVFQSYFSAINASIASMTMTAAVPVFDNGAGSYIRISGTQHMEAVSSMPDWLAQMLHNLILTGQCTDITLELNDSPDDKGTGQWNGFHQPRFLF